MQIPRPTMGILIDEFVIMPNHIHAIIIIDPPRITKSNVGALHATPLRTNRDALGISQRMSAISPKPGSLGAVIRSYKSSVTRWARNNRFPHFAWQRGYHDHIIRDDRDLSRVRRYIRQNPMKWSLDQYHPRD